MGEVVMLGRDAILAAQDVTSELVDVPEWGGSVCVKAMTGEQRDAFETSILKDKADPTKGVSFVDLRARFVARVCVDDKGVRLFTDEDVKSLSRKSAKALDRVYDVGARLAGMRKEDAERLAGNSDAQSDDSTTD
jgi:hypothetical protein